MKPTRPLSVVRKGALKLANSFKPDVIIALGGGSPDGRRENHVGHVRTSGSYFEELARCALWTSVNVSRSSRKWA
ncbi:hypothetical protein KCP77_13600 [Salmonella enterica subsp. enterica]|nr:hypothetical protein KCP77_13600 [Salmonella enterica subsp. enterica]